ncbi:hypothetical protein EYZ11_003534 [Aspergillus tanneri]|uniref:Uncharacterized protein n=1 Tax=Aspergillus tanneri TaxID=1220188 RepID=A0A4S3JQ77_9EURO|nr:hypothetical protein EYZ11_003534 [Aspergillus tanneri]
MSWHENNWVSSQPGFGFTPASSGKTTLPV